MTERNEGFYLREWRQHSNVTQSELATRIGVTKGEISRLEGGSRRMTMEWMNKVSSALGLRPDQLMSQPPSYRTAVGGADDVAQRDPGLIFGVRPLASTVIVEIEGDEMGET